MKMDLSIKGINSLDGHGAGRRVSRETGVSGPVLSNFKHGRRAISLKDARRLAPVFETDRPVALYVESQRRAMKTKFEAGERAAALRAAAVVLEELAKIPEAELGEEGDELLMAVRALEQLIADSLTGEPDEALEEDTGTKKPPKVAKKSRDAHGVAVTEDTGKVQRDAHGVRILK